MIIVLRTVSAVISAYLFLILIRVLLTWFQGVEYGKPYQLICSLTDPYLNYFRRFSFLRLSMLDLSPIAGMLVLVVVLDLLTRIIQQGKLSVGLVLAVIVSSVWSAVSFLLTLFIILTVIRFVMSLSGVNSVGAFVRTVDMLVSPLLEKVRKTFFKKRFVTYNTILATTGVILIALSIAGRFLIAMLTGLLLGLPI
jgi:YggT family protein